MAKFAVGDQVAMPGVPITVTVTGLDTCDDPDCPLGSEIFSFEDPGGHEDWMHASEFEKVVNS